MADTTGPMPLIRWRDEGKRRLGLAFTSLWTEGSLEPKSARRGGDGLVEKAIPAVCGLGELEAHVCRVHSGMGGLGMRGLGMGGLGMGGLGMRGLGRRNGRAQSRGAARVDVGRDVAQT